MLPGNLIGQVSRGTVSLFSVQLGEVDSAGICKVRLGLFDVAIYSTLFTIHVLN
jgi:hypothetical protein